MMENSHFSMAEIEPWLDLANAVIEKAAEDYKALAANEDDYMSTQERWWHDRAVKQIELFFMSSYGEMMCRGKNIYIWERLTEKYK